MDPRRNIYFYYQGQERRDTDRLRQIEDNTTKALLNTLEISAREGLPESLVLPLVRLLGINAAEGSPPPHFALQRAVLSQSILRRARKKVLLGIAPRVDPGPDEPPAATDGGSRPDAWIWGSDYVICIEIKTVGTFSRDQWQRHVTELESVGRKVDCERRTWREIYSFLQQRWHAMQPGNDQATRVLLGQLIEYLDTIAYLQEIPMSEFNGFSSEDFDAFIRIDREEDEDYRPRSRQRLFLLVEAIRERLRMDHPEIVGFETVTRGNISKDSRESWVTLSRQEKMVDEPHFSFTVGPEGIGITLQIEGKRPATAAWEAIRRDPEGFLKSLSNLDPELGAEGSAPYDLILARRYQVRPRKFRESLVCSISVSHVGREDIKYPLQKLEAISADRDPGQRLFEILVRRKFLRDSKGMNERVILVEAVKTVARLAQLERFLASTAGWYG